MRPYERPSMDRSVMILLQIALCLTVLVVETYSSISWAREVLYRTKRQDVCQYDEFRCTSGECINAFTVCDGTKDCADGSDETEIPCKPLNTTDPLFLVRGRGCPLPQPLEFGNYTAPTCGSDDKSAVCRLVPGTPAPENWILSFKCNEGYYFKDTRDGNFNAFCDNGEWSPKIPVCRKMCPPLVSLTVAVICFNEEGDVPCRYPMEPGTRARSECKPLYTLIWPTRYTEIICRDNGQWSHELFNCEPACGKRNRQGASKPLNTNGTPTIDSEFPWHVGIYQTNASNQWEQTCGGSLISPHIVLTGLDEFFIYPAHCVFSEQQKIVLPPNEFKVGLGKYYREWTRDEPNAVKADVRTILIPPLYKGQATSYADDVALIDLTESVQVHASIMPVCVDWKHEFTVTPGTLGTTPKISRTVSFSCPKSKFPCSYGACIDANKQCDGESDCADGSDEVACAFPRSTFSTPLYRAQPPRPTFSKPHMQVQDVPLSHGASEQMKYRYQFRCTSGEQIHTFALCNGNKDCVDGSDETEAVCKQQYSDFWLAPQTGECLLPQPPQFGMYTGAVCGFDNRTANCNQLPWTPVPENWGLVFKCNEGYYIMETQDENSYAFCVNGRWSPKIPVCRKMCSPLVSLSVAVRCFNGDGDVDCSKPMRPGTRAKGECKPSYTQVRPPPYTELICKSDGQWSYELFYCQPVCGKRNVHGVNNPLIVDGSVAIYGEFPWHAGLYMKNSSNQWEQKCGGTLISPHIILSAAHCVFSEQIKEKLPPEAIKVGLGKYYREWTRDEAYAVQADVREILIPSRYYGYATSYTQDIALLDLTDSVQLDAGIMPVCVDWKREFTITHGTLGTLAGWGKTENKTPSDILSYVDLPFVDYQHCIDTVPQVFQHFVTSDKFCAGFSDGAGAAQGDSGGGLMFVRDDLYYVYGIVSTKLQKANSLITFTNVSNVELFIWLGHAKRIFDEAHRET